VKISLNLEIKFRKSVRKSNSKSNSNSKSGPNSIEFGSKVCSSMDSSSSSRRNSSSSSCYVSSKLEVNNLTLYNKTTISSGEIDINLVPRQLKLT